MENCPSNRHGYPVYRIVAVVLRGHLAHSLSLYLAVSSLNAVPLAVGDPIASYQISHHMLYLTHGYWVRFTFWEFQAFVFLFWFWVGWKIDLQLASHDSATAWTIVEVIIGIILSMTLLLHRPYAHLFRHNDGFPIVIIFWGVLLLGYAVFRATRFGSVQNAHSER